LFFGKGKTGAAFCKIPFDCFSEKEKRVQLFAFLASF